MLRLTSRCRGERTAASLLPIHDEDQLERALTSKTNVRLSFHRCEVLMNFRRSAAIAIRTLVAVEPKQSAAQLFTQYTDQMFVHREHLEFEFRAACLPSFDVRDDTLDHL